MINFNGHMVFLDDEITYDIAGILLTQKFEFSRDIVSETVKNT